MSENKVIGIIEKSRLEYLEKEPEYTVSETGGKLNITSPPSPKPTSKYRSEDEPTFSVNVTSDSPKSALRSSGYPTWKREQDIIGKADEEMSDEFVDAQIKEKDKEEKEKSPKGTAENDRINYYSNKYSKPKQNISDDGYTKAKLEIQEMIDALTNEKEDDEEVEKSPSNLKTKLLSGIEHFLEKYEKEDGSNPLPYNTISKSKESANIGSGSDNITLESTLNTFLKGYERLAYLGNDLNDKKLSSLYDLADDINKNKQFDLSLDGSSRLEKVISIDSVAHNLHKQKNEDGSSQYQLLDELADISKSFGERERNTRLIIVNDPTKVENVEKLLNLEILQKGVLEKSGRFWKMFEKAIRVGVEKLSDYEVIALREWIYAKI
jgi:hypothetical protein